MRSQRVNIGSSLKSRRHRCVARRRIISFSERIAAPRPATALQTASSTLAGGADRPCKYTGALE
jgi:hypothetical protein